MGEAACRGPVSVIPRATIWLSTGLLGDRQPAPSPPASRLGECCKLPPVGLVGEHLPLKGFLAFQRRQDDGWHGSRVVSVLHSGAEGPGFKSQLRRCRVTVLGKLFTPIVPLFTKQ